VRERERERERERAQRKRLSYPAVSRFRGRHSAGLHGLRNKIKIRFYEELKIKHLLMRDFALVLLKMQLPTCRELF
jgi:hypothetical protein